MNPPPSTAGDLASVARAARVAGVTLTAAVGGALVAASATGAVLLALLWFRRAEFDGVHDSVVYGSVTGLGFALIASLYAHIEAERHGLVALASAVVRRGILGPLNRSTRTAQIRGSRAMSD